MAVEALAQKQNIVNEQTFDTQVKTGIVDKVTEVSKENVFPVTVAVDRGSLNENLAFAGTVCPAMSRS